MQREFCPCVAWLLSLFVFWVGLKALSFFMLCIVAEQDGLQAKKGNMLLTYSVRSHLAWHCLWERVMFPVPACNCRGYFYFARVSAVAFVFVYVCVCLHAWVCLQQAANSLVDRIVSAVLSESRLSQSRLNRRSCPLLQLCLSSNPSFYNSSKTSVRTLNTCLFMYLLSCQC